MSDILCRKCGEPWESYYVHHEMGKDDGPNAKKRFLSGEGCPACGWGEYCQLCRGDGKDRVLTHTPTGWRHLPIDHPCPRCNGTGKPTLHEGEYEEALFSLMDGTDEDVTAYLG